MGLEKNTIRARVVALEGAMAEVEVAQGGCGRCHETGGCGGQQLTQIFCSGPRYYRVANPLGAQVGEQVTLGVPDGALGRSANLAYGLPVAALIVGAIIGAALAGDPGAMLGAAGGLVAAFVFVIYRSRRSTVAAAENPVIISRS